MTVRQISPLRWYCDRCHKRFANRFAGKRHLTPSGDCMPEEAMLDAGMVFSSKGKNWRISRK